MKKLALGLLAIFLTWLLIPDYKDSWYRRAIPASIGLGLSVYIHDEGSFREGCGVAIFRLSRSTIEQINTQGLSFFDNALQARGHKDYYYRYEKWNQTPTDADSTSNIGNLQCFGDNKKQLYDEITSAIKIGGIFYTTKQEGQLVVIPSLGLVVYSYFG